MHTAVCKKFYANLTMSYYKKKEVARSRVREVEIEFDSMKLATILGVPGNTGICEYIKEVWEESKYIKPLEITRKFANNELLTAVRSEESGSAEKFYDAEDEIQDPADVIILDQTAPATFSASPADSSTVQKEKTTAGVDPSIPSDSIPDTVYLKLQADLEQARARRLQADLDKAQAENARLLALLQQAQSQTNP
ncbi:hypothetical protein Dimus_024380 [Dionaea muscipula]